MGPICKYCNQDMRQADGVSRCLSILKMGANSILFPTASESHEYSGGKVKPPECHDCAAKVGHYHHAGCDWEQCPNCGGQLLSCECWGEESKPAN